jgi:hypothetical protein
MPITIQLCPHGMNERSCPTCYRMKPAAPKPADSLPGTRPGVPLGNVISMADAFQASQRAMAARAAAAPAIKRADGSQVAQQQPYSSANTASSEAHTEDGVWKPPAHPQVADRQPRHPHEGEGKVSYSGPLFVPIDPTTIKAR